jgi:hypothetical protein
MALISSLSFVIACTVSSVLGANFQVQVGENSTLKFDPETIIAQAGDTVTYNFHPKVNGPPIRSMKSQLTFQEPLGHPILLCRSVPPTGRRFLLWFRADCRPDSSVSNNMDDYLQ